MYFCRLPWIVLWGLLVSLVWKAIGILQQRFARASRDDFHQAPVPVLPAGMVQVFTNDPKRQVLVTKDEVVGALTKLLRNGQHNAGFVTLVVCVPDLPLPRFLILLLSSFRRRD
jgi:hypothetical protein